MSYLANREALKTYITSGLVVFLSALILFSCEDPNELGENFIQNQNVGVFFQELPLDGYQKQQDSVLASLNQRILAGKYSDPEFGEVFAEAYVDIDPLSGMPNVNPESTLDSVILTFKIDYLYGDDFSALNSLSIYELENDLGNFRRDTTTVDSLTSELNFVPTSKEKQPYGTQPWASFEIRPLDDVIQKDSVIRTKIDVSVFATVFQKIVEKDSSAILTDAGFSQLIKGFALVPESGSAVFGIDSDSDINNIRLHFHAVGDTSTATFSLQSPRYYSYLEADQTGTELEGISPTDTIVPDDGKLYIQDGIGIVPVLQFDRFKNFSDTVGSLIINSALLELHIDSWNSYMNPINGFFTYVTDSTADELITFDQSSRDIRNNFNPLAINVSINAAGSFTSRRFAGFVPIRVGGNYRNIVYVDLTLFLQQLADGDLNTDELMLYPNSYLMFTRDPNPSSSSLFNVYRGVTNTVNRVVINKNASKLRFYYTATN